MGRIELGSTTIAMNFKEWLVSIGKSEKSAKNYAGAISGVMSSWAAEENLVDQSLLELSTTASFLQVAEGIRKLPIYGDRNTKGKGMYNAALNNYLDYLADITRSVIEDDISELIEDQNLSATEKATLVNIRIGQGQFRKGLVDYWGACAVTGYVDTRLLVASHIKPWSQSANAERLDPFNGLLLLPNLDKAFDLGYISFGASGDIWVSDDLEHMDAFGINNAMQVSLCEEHQGYMAYHREAKFRR